MTHVQYAYAGKQFIRYMLSDTETADAIILYNGWPGEISNKPVMEAFRDAGFHVFNPIYPGLYQSHGRFIDSNIIKEQEDLFATLESGEIENLFLDETISFHVTNTHLIGSSFGGSIALGTASEYNITSLLLFAPVWDWNQQEDLQEEIDFARRAFKHVYRLTDNIQEQLRTQLQLQPKKYTHGLPSKILVFHDPEDEVVKFSETQDAAQNISFELIEHEYGHSMSEPLEKYWDRIRNFLS